MDDIEDWDDIVLTDDSLSQTAKPKPIVGISAEKYVATADNKWDDDFAFDKSDGSSDLFGGGLTPLSPKKVTIIIKTIK